MRRSILAPVLTVILLGGTLFAWYTVYTDFSRFYQYEGTLFRIRDCIVPNPVTTPCFYGAFAFLIAFVWSAVMLRKPGSERLRQLNRLKWLLIAATIFAWGNFLYVVLRFFTNTGEPKVGCSGQIVTNPLNTPCFVGAAIFALALIVALVYRKNLRRGEVL